MENVWRVVRYVVGPGLFALAVVGWPSKSLTVPLAVVAILWILGVGVASLRSLRGQPGPGSAYPPGPGPYDATPAPPGHHHHAGGMGGGHGGGFGGHGGGFGGHGGGFGGGHGGGGHGGD